MKKNTAIIMMVLVSAFGTHAHAQSRFETMLNQIAGLETYLKSTESVYSTTSKGLNDIHDAKNGSFTLNQAYFSSLKNVSPAVKNDPHIQGITDLQQQIQTTFNDALNWQQSKGQLSGDEMSYIKAVYSNLLSECNKDLQELNLVLTNGSVQMTDKDRIDKIDSIYTDMLSKFSFSQSFTGKAYDLANNRLQGKSSNQALQALYNLN